MVFASSMFTTRRKTKLIITVLVFLFIVFTFFNFRFPELILTNFYEKTRIESGNVIVIEGNQSTKYSLVLINVEGKNKKEIKIDECAGFENYFRDAVLVENKIYYVKQRGHDAELIVHFLDSGKKKVIDKFEEESLGTAYSQRVIVKLLYNQAEKQLILYRSGILNLYDIVLEKNIKSIKLWEEDQKIKSQSHNYFVLNSNKNQILEDSGYDRFPVPVYTVISGGSFFAVFSNLLSYGLPFCEYEVNDNDNLFQFPRLGHYTTPVKCDLNGEYKCSVVCPDMKTFASLNELQTGNTLRSDVLAMTRENEFVFSHLISVPLSLNRGGYFQIGPSLIYKVQSLRKAGSNGNIDLFKGVNWDIRKIVSSSDGKYVVFSTSHNDGGLSTFVIDTEGKKKPILLKEGGYPLYVNIAF